jgi:nucleoid-associated protein YgaU
MYQNAIPDLPNLSEEKYENIFSVVLDENNRYFYNLLQAVTLPDNLPSGFFNEYIIVPNDTLPYISYKVYKTINLWWVICIANNINDPTKPFEVGTKLKIPNNTIVRLIVQQIKLPSS